MENPRYTISKMVQVYPLALPIAVDSSIDHNTSATVFVRLDLASRLQSQ